MAGCLIRFIGIIVDIALVLAIMGCSLATVIAMVKLKDDFDNTCPLYANVPPEPTKEIEMGPKVNCNYLMGMHITATVFAFFIGLWRLFETCKQDKLAIKTAVPMGLAMFYLVMAGCILGTAIISTIGFGELCDGLEANRNTTEYTDCKDFQDYADLFPNDIDGEKFYDYLLICEVTSWLSFIAWGAIGVIALFKAICCGRRGDDD